MLVVGLEVRCMCMLIRLGSKVVLFRLINFVLVGVVLLLCILVMCLLWMIIIIGLCMWLDLVLI